MIDDPSGVAPEAGTIAEAAETEARWGDALIRTHDGLRADLRMLRVEVAHYVESTADRTHRIPSLGLQLRANCLAFCEAVHEHHTHEDADGFPVLREQTPHLAPVLDRLAREHVVVARLLDEIRACLTDLKTMDPTHLRTEIDRLTADLEAHLAYEEAQVVETLNTLGISFATSAAQDAQSSRG